MFKNKKLVVEAVNQLRVKFAKLGLDIYPEAHEFEHCIDIDDLGEFILHKDEFLRFIELLNEYKVYVLDMEVSE